MSHRAFPTREQIGSTDGHSYRGRWKISRFLMMTAVPPADEASREHIYPGVQIVDVWPEPENDIDSWLGSS